MPIKMTYNALPKPIYSGSFLFLISFLALKFYSGQLKLAKTTKKGPDLEAISVHVKMTCALFSSGCVWGTSFALCYLITSPILHSIERFN